LKPESCAYLISDRRDVAITLLSACAAASFHAPECWADWLQRGKVLSRKMGVLGDVDEIAVDKLTTAIHGLRLHVIASGQRDWCGAGGEAM
jgi:hypothetical protein